MRPLPTGLKLIDCPVFVGSSGRWASLPSKSALDRAGRRAKPAAAPASNRPYAIYYDPEVKGFGLRVTKAGFRAFVLNYRSRGVERRLTRLSEDAVYRLADKRRKRPLPTGKICGQLIASPAKIREFFAVLANGGDTGETNGDGPAGEMTTARVLELSRGRRRLGR